MRWLMERYWKWKARGGEGPLGLHRTANPCRAAPHPTTRPQQGHDPAITGPLHRDPGLVALAGVAPSSHKGFPGREHPEGRTLEQRWTDPAYWMHGCALQLGLPVRLSSLLCKDRPPASAGHPPGCPSLIPHRGVLRPHSHLLINQGVAVLPR